LDHFQLPRRRLAHIDDPAFAEAATSKLLTILPVAR